MQSSEQPEAAANRYLLGFPPRSELPLGVTVKRLPGFGTTWYERGPAYWMRRLGATLLMGGMLALVIGILWLFLKGVYQSSGRHAWFYGLLSFEILFSVVTCILLLIRLIKHPVTEPGDTKGVRGWARRGAGLGILARSGLALAQLFFVLIAALSLGMWLALFLRTFTPVLPPERRARQELAEQLRRRTGDIGHGQHAGSGGNQPPETHHARDR